MEDLSRNVEQDRKIANHLRKTKRSGWTLLLVGELGNIVSLRLPKALVVTLAAALGTMFAFAVFAMVTYYGTRSENITLKNGLDDVKADLVAANKAKDGALVRLMLLEAKVKPDKKSEQHKEKAKLAPVVTHTKDASSNARPDSKKDESASHNKPQPVISEAITPSAPPPTAGTKHAAAKEAKPEEDPLVDEETDSGGPAETGSFEGITVEAAEIWPTPDGTSVKFQFSLRNIDPENRKIRGHTFVVLEAEEGSDEPARVSPWTPLKDGRPSMFKRGQYFGIARFKYVKGRFPDMRDVQRFKTATIYVYSESGKLLVEEVYELDKILRS